MNFRSMAAVCSCALLAVAGCEEPFSPKGEFRDEPVVYAVISDLSDQHFARLYRTYNPPAYDPFEQTADNPLTGALVRLTEGSSQWTFRDTVIARPDTSRYQSPINAYVYSPLRIERGKTYTLVVQPQSGEILTASAAVPDMGFVSIYRNQTAITSPVSTFDRTIGVRVTIPSTTKGYLVRFIVTFDVLENAVWMPHTVEIPYFINNVSEPDETYLYHELTRSNESAGSPGRFITHLRDFDVDSYYIVISRLYNRYGSINIRFKKAIFTVTQVEHQIYNYYSVSMGFRDPRSIRLDEPDYTNVNGAVGVFGAFGVDSTTVTLPTSL